MERDAGIQRIAWDERGTWRYLENETRGSVVRLEPGRPLVAGVSTRRVAAPAIWQEVLREPAGWLPDEIDVPGAAWGHGLAALIVPFATWAVEEDVAAVAAALPIPAGEAAAHTDATRMAEMLTAIGEWLGRRSGPRAWPTILCLGCAAALEGDQAGMAAVLADLQPLGRLGPVGSLALATLLRLGRQPAAAQVARQGLAVCTEADFRRDLGEAVGGDAGLLRWLLAIERPERIALLVPPPQREGLAADLRALQTAAASDRPARLEAVLAGCWRGWLGGIVRQELARLAGAPRAIPLP